MTTDKEKQIAETWNWCKNKEGFDKPMPTTLGEWMMINKAAIRLWREAFQAGQDDLLKNDELIREWTEQARADERRKCKHVIETEGYEASPEVKKIMDEQYEKGRASALGKRECPTHHTLATLLCLPCALEQGEEKGRAEGIEAVEKILEKFEWWDNADKLKVKEAIAAARRDKR